MGAYATPAMNTVLIQQVTIESTAQLNRLVKKSCCALLENRLSSSVCVCVCFVCFFISFGSLNVCLRSCTCLCVNMQVLRRNYHSYTDECAVDVWSKRSNNNTETNTARYPVLFVCAVVVVVVVSVYCLRR